MRALFLLLACVPLAAHAQDALELARAADRDGEIPRARELYEGALEAGGLDPSRTSEAHLRLGALCRAMGEDALAERHFAVVLAIDPEHAPPPDLPPAGREAFEALRASASRVDVEIGDREADRVEIRARGAPGLVAALRVRVGDAPADRREGIETVIELPEREIELEVAALDAHGNELAVRSTTIAAPAVLSTQETLPGPATASVPEWWQDAGLWIGVGLGAVAIAASVIVTVVILGENDRLAWSLGSTEVVGR